MSDLAREIAVDPDKPQMHISNSELYDFNLCPRQWWFGYVLRCVVKRDAPALALGTAAHAVLEQFHTGKILGDGMVDALEAYEGQVDTTPLVAAFERYAKANHWWLKDIEITGVEEERYWPIPDTDGLLFKAILDIVAINRAGQEIVIDHKTTTKFDSRYLRVDQQATAYLWATGAPYMIFSYLKKVKNPSEDTELFKQIMVARTPGAISRFARRLAVSAQLAHDAREHARSTGNVPDITPGWHCRDCKFLVPCGFIEHDQQDMAREWLDHNAPPDKPLDEWRL